MLRENLWMENLKKRMCKTVHTLITLLTGDDSSTVVVRKKKKKKTNVLIGGDKPMNRLDGRTKAYKLHNKKITSTKREKTKTKRFKI